ncbi:MAG: NifB/NifX family molybdenum-iron cluster-binding protein [Candidatus Margulisiibacteriota bacterium]
MRIGVTLDNDSGLESNVCPHFGQCTHFLIADVDNSTVTAKKVVPNNAVHGGGGCLAVDEIRKYGVTHVISGGMGMGAQQKFRENGIIVFGHAGKAKEAIEDLLKNGLGGLEACSHGHQHKEGE